MDDTWGAPARRVAAATLVALLACSGNTADAQPPAPAAATVRVDPNVSHQTIADWEATAYAGQEAAGFLTWRDEMVERAVTELGITRLRLEVRSGVEHDADTWAAYRAGTIDYAAWRAIRYATVNDNDDPRVLRPDGFHFAQLDYVVDEVVEPMRRVAARAGEPLRINVNYVAFTGQIKDGAYHHADPDEYAEFVLATHLHIRDRYGWVPDYWEVLLEPDNVRQWNGRLIGQAIAAAGARLAENGFTTRFIAPSTTSMGNAITWFDQLAAVPGALDLLVELSYHRYSGVSDANLLAIAERGRAQALRTAMLEHIGSGYADLHQDLKVGNNSSWAQFTLGGPGDSDGGGSYYRVDVADPAHPVVRLAQRTPGLRAYFRHVRPGAVRIGAESDAAEFDSVAFRNADGGHVVVVKADAAGDVTVSGLPASTYALSTVVGTLVTDGGRVTVAAGEGVRGRIAGAGVMVVVDVGGRLYLPLASAWTADG